ncbi:MAG: lysophospholipid acyltransferase family protein [Pseudomonadota bacterium]
MIGLWVRSLVFVAVIYALMLLMGVLGLPLLLWSRDLTYAWMKLYCRLVFRLAWLFCGIETEIRGAVPSDPVLVAAKHQSLLDVLMLFAALPRPTFVMKRSLLWAPIFGLYTWRLGTIVVDRAGKGQGERMAHAAEAQGRYDGQIVIYPQGTRVPPGEVRPYRRGAALIAQRTGLPVALAATNAGWFWPRRGVLRHPGRAVVEFLGRLPPDAQGATLMARIEAEVEAASDRLGAEASTGLKT